MEKKKYYLKKKVLLLFYMFLFPRKSCSQRSKMKELDEKLKKEKKVR
jgi:hypothetical protein